MFAARAETHVSDAAPGRYYNEHLPRTMVVPRLHCVAGVRGLCAGSVGVSKCSWHAISYFVATQLFGDLLVLPSTHHPRPGPGPGLQISDLVRVLAQGGGVGRIWWSEATRLEDPLDVSTGMWTPKPSGERDDGVLSLV
jgi:hypothetical protein